jgi:glycosyltransferase involved in cell wall biosynthesis
VLLEAQSQRLACVSTWVSGVPELIEDGETGLLVPPGDRAALGAALERLIRDPGLRARLAAAGEARTRAAFDADIAIEALAAKFGLLPQPAPARELADAS